MKKTAAKLTRLFETLAFISPLSLRGFIALGISALCLYYLAKEYSDLVSSILGISLLILLTFFTLILIFSAPYIRKKISISPQDQNTELISRRENSTGFTVNNIKIPPFFYLSIQRAIDDKHVRHTTHILRGSTSHTSSRRTCLDTIHFPHRGVYESRGYILEFGDILGLSKRKWLHELPLLYQVFTPRSEIAPLPIMAASTQLGDTETSQKNKSGDLFNIRTYQAGDSLKRILWKVYARSGNLVVREPEPAIIPEGEVAVFVLAQKREDSVVSCALSYLRMLERQNIIYRTGFSGSPEIASDYEAANLLSIEASPRNSYEGSYRNAFTHFIENLKNKNQEAQHIVVFFNEALISGTRSEELNKMELTEGRNILDKIMREATDLNIQLHLASTPDTNHRKATGKKPKFTPDKEIQIPVDYPHVKVQIESIA